MLFKLLLERCYIHNLDLHTSRNAASNALNSKLTNLSLFLKFPPSEILLCFDKQLKKLQYGGPNPRRGAKSARGLSPPGVQIRRRICTGGPNLGGLNSLGHRSVFAALIRYRSFIQVSTVCPRVLKWC